MIKFLMMRFLVLYRDNQILSGRKPRLCTTRAQEFSYIRSCRSTQKFLGTAAVRDSHKIDMRFRKTLVCHLLQSSKPALNLYQRMCKFPRRPGCKEGTDMYSSLFLCCTTATPPLKSFHVCSMEEFEILKQGRALQDIISVRLAGTFMCARICSAVIRERWCGST